MKTLIISCQMIKEELLQAMQETGCDYEVLWLERGLHEYPKKLQKGLQEILSGITGVDRVLMALGDCGGGTQELKIGDYELIYPRMDDCVTLLLGSIERRKELSSQGYYYLSEGWLSGSRTLMTEYTYTVEKYGEDVAEMVMESMLHNYRYMGLLRTSAADVEDLKQRTCAFCRTFNLQQIPVDVTLDWLKQLLTGPWPEDRFVTVAPGRRTPEHCVL